RLARQFDRARHAEPLSRQGFRQLLLSVPLNTRDAQDFPGPEGEADIFDARLIRRREGAKTLDPQHNGRLARIRSTMMERFRRRGLSFRTEHAGRNLLDRLLPAKAGKIVRCPATHLAPGPEHGDAVAE